MTPAVKSSNNLSYMNHNCSINNKETRLAAGIDIESAAQRPIGGTSQLLPAAASIRPNNIVAKKNAEAIYKNNATQLSTADDNTSAMSPVMAGNTS